MAPTASFGVETGNAHFGRAAFPLQGWLSMTNDMSEVGERKPVKMVTHFIAENGVAPNHHFTLTAFDQLLELLVVEDQFDASQLEKLVLLSDGCASQNWYYLALYCFHINFLQVSQYFWALCSAYQQHEDLSRPFLPKIKGTCLFEDCCWTW